MLNRNDAHAVSRCINGAVEEDGIPEILIYFALTTHVLPKGSNCTLNAVKAKRHLYISSRLNRNATKVNEMLRQHVLYDQAATPAPRQQLEDWKAQSDHSLHDSSCTRGQSLSSRHSETDTTDDRHTRSIRRPPLPSAAA